jgi:hypothetical protein
MADHVETTPRRYRDDARTTWRRRPDDVETTPGRRRDDARTTSRRRPDDVGTLLDG